MCTGKHIHTWKHMDAHLLCTFAQASNVKSSLRTLLTSNVTNNYFLQLHCSNPFSGLQNGNIITFLWCSAFDKTAACWAECLTELDASVKPTPLSTLLLSLTQSSPPLSHTLSHIFSSSLFVLSPPLALSVISKSSFCVSLSLLLSPAQVLQWIREVLSTLLMAPQFRRLTRGACSPLWLAQMDWCRRSRLAVMHAWTSAR